MVHFLGTRLVQFSIRHIRGPIATLNIDRKSNYQKSPGQNRSSLWSLSRGYTTSSSTKNPTTIHQDSAQMSPTAGVVAGDDSSVAYRIIYRFPHIRTARAISRMKLYQTALTGTCVPLSIFLYSNGHAGPEVCIAAVSVSSFAAVMLCVMSAYTRRLIGLVAVSGDGSVIRLSHLTFWGKRHDVYVPPEDVVPFSDTSENESDAYLKVRRYSSPDVLYLTLKYGQIVDQEAVARVFGRQ